MCRRSTLGRQVTYKMLALPLLWPLQRHTHIDRTATHDTTTTCKYFLFRRQFIFVLQRISSVILGICVSSIDTATRKYCIVAMICCCSTRTFVMVIVIGSVWAAMGGYGTGHPRWSVGVVIHISLKNENGKP